MYDFSSYIKEIFEAKTVFQVCDLLNDAIKDLKNSEHIEGVYSCYQDIRINDAEDINTFFIEMKNDNAIGEYEEGVMKEFYGLFNAAYDMVLELRAKS